MNEGRSVEPPPLGWSKSIPLGKAILLKNTNYQFIILLNLSIIVLVFPINLSKDGGCP